MKKRKTTAKTTGSSFLTNATYKVPVRYFEPPRREGRKKIANYNDQNIGVDNLT
jgi:hypothetical protein